MLGRKVGWSDLAFFDPIMFESLRQLVCDSEAKDSSALFTALDLTFSIDLSQDEVCLM